MQSLHRSINPFALMIDPQAVIAQIECSGRLERLTRRICRPLDKPLLGAVGEDADDRDVFGGGNASGSVVDGANDSANDSDDASSHRHANAG